MRHTILIFALCGVLVLGLNGCCRCACHDNHAYNPGHSGGGGGGGRANTKTIEVVAYDAGPISCNWTRDARGRTVVASGPNRGQPKEVGITASGTKAKKGTIAADTKYYPFGTKMYIPGYGHGVVEDRGSSIKGPNIIDVFMNSREDALDWGRQNLPVKVYK